MRWTERRQKFRAVLDGDECVNPGSVFDPISARLAYDAGYEIGIVAGSVAAMTVLGSPDHVVMSLSDLAEQCQRISRAAPLPLLIDADHGFGNALSVMRTVEELEIAGVSAITIEDTDLPRQFRQTESVPLIPVEEGVGKMRAALEARQDPSLAIVGRTSAPQATDIDETIRRLSAYEEAGVDALFVVGLKSPEDLAALSDATSLPLIISPPGPGWPDRLGLAERRVRICLQPHLPFLRTVQSLEESYRALRAGTAPADLPGRAAPDLMARATRADVYKKWIGDFLE